MGQYYKPSLKIGAKTWKGINTWDFNCGSKLIEHSYIGNPVVEEIEKHIYRTPTQVVWAGDYADNEKRSKKNIYEIAKKLPLETKNVGEFNYLVNHTKGLYIDLSKIEADEYGYKIHPLPLLTAEGNGRGGGDYNGTSYLIVGSWARDFISVETIKPSNLFAEIIPKFKLE